MMDIETLGVKGKSVVVQIALIAFDIVTGKKEGHISIYPHVLEQIVEADRTSDPDTLSWWRRQPDLIKNEVLYHSNVVSRAESVAYKPYFSQPENRPDNMAQNIGILCVKYGSTRPYYHCKTLDLGRQRCYTVATEKEEVIS
jgi:hypothetical protein